MAGAATAGAGAGVSLRVDERGDVNQVELATLAFVGGIYADEAAVRAEAGVGVAPPFASVAWWAVEVAEPEPLSGGNVVEIDVLKALGAEGVGVVENPLSAG